MTMNPIHQFCNHYDFTAKTEPYAFTSKGVDVRLWVEVVLVTNKGWWPTLVVEVDGVCASERDYTTFDAPLFDALMCGLVTGVRDGEFVDALRHYVFDAVKNAALLKRLEAMHNRGAVTEEQQHWEAMQ